MLVTENGKRIFLLGDPHLGRAFVNGVPLARRGERERMVWEDFCRALDPADPDLDYHVCLGDLFDKWIVSFDLIIAVADEYERAALARPDCTFVILKGNHDWQRDLERRSAFDVFAKLVAGVPNILIVDHVETHDGLIFYPWHPLWNAREVLADQEGIVFGHFDTEFSHDNMVPTDLGFERIYTGHVHKPERFNRHGTEVVVVGSMQPYAHGEEVNDDLYITLRPDEIAGRDLRNKCVRIIGKFDGDIDCLQLGFKAEEKDDQPIETVTMGDFDMDKLFAEAFAEAGVSEERTAVVLEHYHSKRVANGTA